MITEAEKTDRYAVVGHPVQHSRSPMIHQLFARQTGEKLSYELIDASPSDFEVAIRGFGAAGGKGLNITVPHKQAAFELATECSIEAGRANAVNTLSFKAGGAIHGDNTDGSGFYRDLSVNQAQTVADKRVLILGAGGATRGILAPLLDAQATSILIANRTVARAELLVEQFDGDKQLAACEFGALEAQQPFDIVINATSAGMRGESLPFPEHCVGPMSFCYDLAYGLKGTPFVSWARGQGVAKAVQGWGMLVEQAAESFYIWRGVRPDTAAILAKIAV
jgi:shikimate dehydrogenase